MLPIRSFSSLNDSTTPMSDKDVLSLQKRIQAISSALQTIQLEKNDSRADVPDIYMERFLQSRRDAYLAFLSPLRRIPPEIWEKIFLCIPSEVILVSQVCRIWRRTSIGIPSLWPKELLVFLEPRRNIHRTMLACFIRTSDSPSISGCLIDRKNAPLPSPSSVSIILDLRLIPSKVPLKQLYVAPELVRQLFGDDYLKRKYWDALEELVIDRSSSKTGAISSLRENDPISLTHLYALTRLTINLKNRISVSYILAPWNQLDYLHLDGTYSNTPDCIRIISSCHRLRTLILACHPPAERRKPSTRRIVIPRLKSLTLIGGDTIAAMLTHLECPSLTSLSLSSQILNMPKARAYQDSAEDIMRLLEASACTLLELSLHCIFLADFEIPDCFRAMPALDALRVADNGGMSDLLQCLRTGYREPRARGAPVHLAPKLTTLIVETNTPEHWPQDSFNAMCNLRRTTAIRGSEGCQLKKARLAYEIRPFKVYSELTSFVRSLGPAEGINLAVPYVATRKRVAGK